MIKKTLLSLSILSTVFTACTSYSITKDFDRDAFYNQAIQYTKKTDIISKLEPKYIMTATYLNAVDKKYKNDYENFIIGIYEVASKKTLNLKTLNLTLNEEEPVDISPIKSKNLLKSLPLKNNWANYYLVTFKRHTNSLFKKTEDNLNLTLQDPKYGSASVSFLKEL